MFVLLINFSICFANNPKTKYNHLISEKEISKKIKSVSEQINKEYENKPLVMVMIMKGAVCFAVDLLRNLNDTVVLEYIDCKSYKKTVRKELTIKGIDELDITGKHVLLVDDIFDSGNTLTQAIKAIKKKNPKSLKSMVLLLKQSKRVEGAILPDISLFEIPNKFVVGYGLDDDGKSRGLKEIYYFKDEVVK